jgi:hypothetical protein
MLRQRKLPRSANALVIGVFPRFLGTTVIATNATLIGVVDGLSACDERGECFLTRRRQFTDFPLDACLDPAEMPEQSSSMSPEHACIEAFNQPFLSASGLVVQQGARAKDTAKAFLGDRLNISLDSGIESDCVSRGPHNGLLSVRSHYRRNPENLSSSWQLPGGSL